MKLWLRINDIKQDSYTVVWNSLRKSIGSLTTELWDNLIASPDGDFIELWWGNSQSFKWSGEAKYKVGLVLSETLSLLDAHIEPLRNCDFLICPSESAARAYYEAPLDIPIIVVPFGVDSDTYRYAERDWNGIVKFLLAGAAQLRKGTWLGIEAFLRAFRHSKKVQLTVWSSVKTPLWVELANQYSASNIVFDPNYYENSMDVLRSHHILVSPHLAEGFGLLIPEAMATGMPCIVSRCSAPREFFDTQYGWWIEMSNDYIPVNNADDPILKKIPGFWRLPDFDSLVKVYKEAANIPVFAKEKGKLASQYVQNNLTWDHTSENILCLLEKRCGFERNGNNNSI